MTLCQHTTDQTQLNIYVYGYSAFETFVPARFVKKWDSMMLIQQFTKRTNDHK